MSDEEDRMEAAKKRYFDAAHAVQSGVMYKMQLEKSFVSRKHLRTGIDCQKADMEGLVTLLISKGILTELEYMEALATSMEREQQRWEQEISKLMKTAVTLG
jgi:hypothetical protein